MLSSHQKLVTLTATTFETATTFVGIALKQNVIDQYRGIKFAHLRGRWTAPVVCNDYTKVPRVPIFSKSHLNNKDYQPNSSGQPTLLYDATNFGPIAPQPHEDITGYYAVPKQVALPMPDSAVQDELELLNLVVTRPSSEIIDKPVPVVVFIHGGSNGTGSAANPLYDGATLAHRALLTGKPIIIVHIQYRLGAFGWMHINGQGNWGFLDQKAALGWVKQHISDFGGDPDNITVLGLSAGSCDTYYQTMLDILGVEGCPDTPLFSRIALMSGVGQTMTLKSIESQQAVKKEIARDLGFEITENVQALDTHFKNASQETLVKTGIQSGGIRIWYGTKDGVVIPTNWNSSLEKVPSWLGSVLLSDTADEGMLFSEQIAKVDPKLSHLLASSAEGSEIVAGYNLHSSSLFHRGLQDLFADYVFSYPISVFQKSLLGGNVDTFRMCFDSPNPFEPSRGSLHGVDMLYLFGSYLPDGYGDPKTISNVDKVINVSHDLQDVYIRFFYTGKAWEKSGLAKCYSPDHSIKMVNAENLLSLRRTVLAKIFENHGPEALGGLLKTISSL